MNHAGDKIPPGRAVPVDFGEVRADLRALRADLREVRKDLRVVRYLLIGFFAVCWVCLFAIAAAVGV